MTSPRDEYESLDMVLIVWCNSEIVYQYYAHHFVSNPRIQTILLVPESANLNIPPNHTLFPQRNHVWIHVYHDHDNPDLQIIDAMKIAMEAVHETPGAYVWLHDWLCPNTSILYDGFLNELCELMFFDMVPPRQCTPDHHFNYFSLTTQPYELELQDPTTDTERMTLWASHNALRSI
jgi:hypothetical protein